MWIRLAERFRFGCVPETLVYAGAHAGPRVSKSVKAAVEANRMIYRKHEARRRALGAGIERAALASLLKTEGDIYTFHARRLQGILSYGKGIMIAPAFTDNYTALGKALLPMHLRKVLAWRRARVREKV